MKTMNIKSTDNRVQSTEYRVQSTESGSVPGSVLATIRKASVLCTLCSVLLISSCTHDEITPPVNTTNDALALLPGNTRVGIKAEITDNREQGTETRAEGDESVTTYYALNEIHADKDVEFTMYLPGASDDNNLQRRGTSTLNTLANTEPYSTLMLKDFNLTEGNGRCVSRWTVLTASSGGTDNLWGWARLTADANGQPVLNYAMQRGNAKVTIVVQDENGQPVYVSGDKVTATVSLPKTTSEVIYTPEGETEGKHLNFYLQTEVKTLAADEAIDPNRIALGTSAGGTENTDFTFDGMLTTDVNGYYGENNNTLTAIVSATATHTTTNSTTFTPIVDGPQFTGEEKLTIEVLKDPDGNGSQTTGTYSLKLSEVKLSDNEYLTALEPGKHYTLTVTLRHNTLVAATATISAWSTASANATWEGDGAFMPNYTYDAATNTYTIFEEGIEAALADRAANHPDAVIVYNGLTVVPRELASEAVAVVSGIETDLATVQTAIAGKPHIIVKGETLAKYGDNPNSASTWTVLGQAIRTSEAANGTVSLILLKAITIGENAFYRCTALKSVTLAAATTIGHSAFGDCTALASVSLPEAETIGDNAFSDCNALTSVSLPKATSIGSSAFGTCQTLTNVSAPKATTIDSGAFYRCTALTTVSLPEATSIGINAFIGCTALTSLTFGKVTYVDKLAFYEFPTENCDLTLATGQEHIDYDAYTGTPNGKPVIAADASAERVYRTWAGVTWKSITLK